MAAAGVAAADTKALVGSHPCGQVRDRSCPLFVCAPMARTSLKRGPCGCKAIASWVPSGFKKGLQSPSDGSFDSRR